LKLACAGAEEGLVISAEYQSRGRGRYDRAWISSPGENLLFSILLRPPVGAARASMLTHIAVTGVRDALRLFCPGLEFTIKKPNDLLANEKKICGILVESSTQGERIEYAVIGIGLNLLSSPGDRIQNVTSIYEETGAKIGKNDVLNGILHEFDAKYQEYRSELGISKTGNR